MVTKQKTTKTNKKMPKKSINHKTKHVSMDKVKIKRVKRQKKEISTKEKVLAGLGVGSTLLGGAGAVMPKSQSTQFVRTQEKGQNSNVAKVKQKLKDIFGIKRAEAEEAAPDEIFDSVEEPVVSELPDGSETPQIITQNLPETEEPSVTQPEEPDQQIPVSTDGDDTSTGGQIQNPQVINPDLIGSLNDNIDTIQVTPDEIPDAGIDTSGLQTRDDINNSLTGTIKIGGADTTVSVLPDGRIFDTNGVDITSTLNQSDADLIRTMFTQAPRENPGGGGGGDSSVTVTNVVNLNMSGYDEGGRQWREGTVEGVRYAVFNGRLFNTNGEDVTDSVSNSAAIIAAIDASSPNLTIVDNRVVDRNGNDVTNTPEGRGFMNAYATGAQVVTPDFSTPTGPGGGNTPRVETPAPGNVVNFTQQQTLTAQMQAHNNQAILTFLSRPGTDLSALNLNPHTLFELLVYMQNNNLGSNLQANSIGQRLLTMFPTTNTRLSPGSGTQGWNTEGLTQAYNSAVRPFEIKFITGPSGERLYQVIVDMGSGKTQNSQMMTSQQVSAFLENSWKTTDNFMALSQTDRAIFAAFVNAGLQYPEFFNNHVNLPRPNTAITETITYVDATGVLRTVTQPWDPSGLSTRAEAEFLQKMFPGSRIVEESQPNSQYANATYTINYNGDSRRRYNLVLANGGNLDVALTLSQYRMYGADSIVGINNIPGFSVDGAKSVGVTDATGPVSYVTQDLQTAMGSPANNPANRLQNTQGATISQITIPSTWVRGQAYEIKITGTKLSSMNLGIQFFPKNFNTPISGFSIENIKATDTEYIYRVTPSLVVAPGQYVAKVASASTVVYASEFSVQMQTGSATSVSTGGQSSTQTGSTTSNTGNTTDNVVLTTGSNLGANTAVTNANQTVSINNVTVLNEQGQDAGLVLKTGYKIQIGGTNLTAYNDFQVVIGSQTYNFTNYTISDNQILLTVPSGLPTASGVKVKMVSRISGLTGFLDKTFTIAATSTTTTTSGTTGNTTTGTTIISGGTSGTTTISGNTTTTSGTTSTTDVSAYQNEINRLNSQISSLNQQIASLSSQLGSNSSTAQLAAANQTIAQLNANIQSLLAQISSLQAGQVRVLGSGTAPSGLQMPQGYSNNNTGLQYQAPAAVQGVQTNQGAYTVKKGDTLWAISKKYYGDGRQWRKILEANPDCLSRPGNTRTLRIGAVLVIPS